MGNIYIGDSNNLARKLSNIYVGDANGIARKVQNIYIGDANGIARKVYTAIPPYTPPVKRSTISGSGSYSGTGNYGELYGDPACWCYFSAAEVQAAVAHGYTRIKTYVEGYDSSGVMSALWRSTTWDAGNINVATQVGDIIYGSYSGNRTDYFNITNTYKNYGMTAWNKGGGSGYGYIEYKIEMSFA